MDNYSEINKAAGLVAILGGILMLLSGTTGAATWSELGEIVIEYTGIDSLGIVFQVLVLIGSLGGIVVILGGLMFRGNIWAENDKRFPIGKLLITLGAGLGLFGVIIMLIMQLWSPKAEGNLLMGMGQGFAGILLSIFARQYVTYDKEPKEEKTEELAEDEYDDEDLEEEYDDE